MFINTDVGLLLAVSLAWRSSVLSLGQRVGRATFFKDRANLVAP